jgi:hypothetical protein
MNAPIQSQSCWPVFAGFIAPKTNRADRKMKEIFYEIKLRFFSFIDRHAPPPGHIATGPSATRILTASDLLPSPGAGHYDPSPQSEFERDAG